MLKQDVPLRTGWFGYRKLDVENCIAHIRAAYAAELRLARQTQQGMEETMAQLRQENKALRQRFAQQAAAQAAQLDENARMLRYLRGRMKLNDGVVEPLFRERFGQELPQEFSTLLDKAVENGLAQRTADGWMPTLEGLFRGEVL